MAGHIDDSRLVFARQRQEASGEIHGAKEICVDLILDDGIRLPFEFAKAHDARIVHQIAKLQILVFGQEVDYGFLNVQNAGAFANVQFHQMETLRIALVQ